MEEMTSVPISNDMAVAVRKRQFNTAVMRLAYERYFGLTRFANIPEGTAIIYRGSEQNKFNLITKVSEVDDRWISGCCWTVASLMEWTNSAAVVFHFGPGLDGVVKVFDVKTPLTEVMHDLDIDKFILSMDPHSTPAGCVGDEHDEETCTC